MSRPVVKSPGQVWVVPTLQLPAASAMGSAAAPVRPKTMAARFSSLAVSASNRAARWLRRRCAGPACDAMASGARGRR